METIADRGAAGRRSSRRVGGTAAVMTAVALAAAACSSSGGSGKAVASVTGAPSASASSKNGPSAGDPLAFAKCMRQHGIANFKDPEVGKPFADGVDTTTPAFQKAQGACQAYAVPAPPAGGGADDAWSPAKKLDYAKCMRTNGVTRFPDPNADGGFMLPQGVDPNTPQFKKADRTCGRYKPAGIQTMTPVQPGGNQL